jgi:hypothetical protein
MSWMQGGLEAIVLYFNAIARSIVEEGSGSKFLFAALAYRWSVSHASQGMRPILAEPQLQQLDLEES